MNSSPSQGKNGSAIGLTCSWKGEKCQNDITSARDLPSAATNAEQSLRPSFLPRFQPFAIDRLAGDEYVLMREFLEERGRLAEVCRQDVRRIGGHPFAQINFLVDPRVEANQDPRGSASSP